MEESVNFYILDKLINQTNKVLFIFEIESASLTFLNNAFNQVWKRTKESILTHPSLLLETIHPDDKAYLNKEYKELIKGIIKDRIEFRIFLPDNTIRWLTLMPQLINNKQGKRYITGLVEDITLLKDNMNNLEKFAAKKDSILEILSHDLAGPMANIQHMANLLGNYTKALENNEINNIIRLIKESSARNIRMIRDFVQQEFLESSRVDLFKKRDDLVRKFKEAIEQYKDGEDHIKKEIRFTASSEKIFAFTDPNKFMQVINNLISNAIKFTRDDGIISVDITEKDTTILITVQDNGIGIPKRFHNELFEKFTKARREGLRGEPSTGLGMSIIKTIVEWHGGKIWFESEENAGSTFFVEIPKI